MTVTMTDDYDCDKKIRYNAPPSNWMKLEKVGSNWFTLVKIGSSWIKLDYNSYNWLAVLD